MDRFISVRHYRSENRRELEVQGIDKRFSAFDTIIHLPSESWRRLSSRYHRLYPVADLYYGNFIQAPDVDIRNPFSIRIEISSDLFCEWKKEKAKVQWHPSTLQTFAPTTAFDAIVETRLSRNELGDSIEFSTIESAKKVLRGTNGESIFLLSWPFILQWSHHLDTGIRNLNRGRNFFSCVKFKKRCITLSAFIYYSFKELYGKTDASLACRLSKEIRCIKRIWERRKLIAFWTRKVQMTVRANFPC